MHAKRSFPLHIGACDHPINDHPETSAVGWAGSCRLHCAASRNATGLPLRGLFEALRQGIDPRTQLIVIAGIGGLDERHGRLQFGNLGIEPLQLRLGIVQLVGHHKPGHDGKAGITHFAERRAQFADGGVEGFRQGAQPRLIAILARFGPLSANGVCARAEMDKVRVSRAVARAMASGLIDRRIDRADRRRSILTLTPRGRAIHDEIVPRALEREAEVIGTLEEEEAEALFQLIGRLQGQANALKARIANS